MHKPFVRKNAKQVVRPNRCSVCQKMIAAHNKSGLCSRDAKNKWLKDHFDDPKWKKGYYDERRKRYYKYHHDYMKEYMREYRRKKKNELLQQNEKK